MEKPKDTPKKIRPEQTPSASSIQQMSSSSDPREQIREVPEAVNERLLSRMLIFSLGPVLLGIISLPLLAYIQVFCTDFSDSPNLFTNSWSKQRCDIVALIKQRLSDNLQKVLFSERKPAIACTHSWIHHSGGNMYKAACLPTWFSVLLPRWVWPQILPLC